MADVPRNHQGRPYIVTPDGDLQAYTRTSKLAHSLSDSYALEMHHLKEVMIGIFENQWLLGKIGAAYRAPEKDDWDGKVRTAYYNHQELMKWSAVAMEYAGTNVKSGYGNRIHELTERLDTANAETGDGLPDLDSLDEREYVDLMAYAHGTEGFRMEHREKFVVNDEIKVAGTLDHALWIGGKLRIGDLKTGREKAMEWEMQAATYARSLAYQCTHEPILGENLKPVKEGCEGSNLSAHKRDCLGIESDWGVLLLLPAGEGRLQWKRLDLERGWRNVQLAVEARAARRSYKLENLDESELVPF